MNNRMQKLKLNSFIGIFYQFTLVITGFILPRCFLEFYGSNVNGLVASISQFLSLINICDMGIGAVVQSALYKPLADKDTLEISRVFLYSKRFFRIISYILFCYVIALTLIYPQIASRNFSTGYTVILILAMSISTFGQYFIGITYQLLLNADQRGYIQSLVNATTLIVNTFLSVILMYNGASIQSVKITTSIIYLARPMFLYIYVHKHYVIDRAVKVSGDAVPEKKSGIMQHLAYMIYQNTDIIVLTIFSTYASISIYSTYVLVTNGIRSLINVLLAGFEPLFGNLIAGKEKERLDSTFRKYNWFIHTVCTLLFSVTSILVVPFILIYTRGVSDADYNVPVFACFITLAYFFNVLRNALYVLIKASGHYKRTQNASLAEAIINVVLSIFLVFRIGIVGVAIGTVFAEMFFLIYENVYLSNNIIFCSLNVQIRQFCIDMITAVIYIALCSWIKISTLSYLSWIKSAIVVFAICSCVCFLIQMVFYKENVKMLHCLVKRKSL